MNGNNHWFHLLITHRENTAGKIEPKRPHKLYQIEKKNCVFQENISYRIKRKDWIKQNF